MRSQWRPLRTGQRSCRSAGTCGCSVHGGTSSVLRALSGPTLARKVFAPRRRNTVTVILKAERPHGNFELQPRRRGAKTFRARVRPAERAGHRRRPAVDGAAASASACAGALAGPQWAPLRPHAASVGAGVLLAPTALI